MIWPLSLAVGTLTGAVLYLLTGGNVLHTALALALCAAWFLLGVRAAHTDEQAHER